MHKCIRVVSNVFVSFYIIASATQMASAQRGPPNQPSMSPCLFGFRFRIFSLSGSFWKRR
jgi:hypothetical protein